MQASTLLAAAYIAAVALALTPSIARSGLEQTLDLCAAASSSDRQDTAPVLARAVRQASEQLQRSVEGLSWVRNLARSSDESEKSRRRNLGLIYTSGPAHWLLLKERLCGCASDQGLHLEQCVALAQERTQVCALRPWSRPIAVECLTKDR